MKLNRLASKLYYQFRLAYHEAWKSEEAHRNSEDIVNEIAECIKLANKTEDIQPDPNYHSPEDNPTPKRDGRIEISKKLDRIHQAITEGGSPSDYE